MALGAVAAVAVGFLLPTPPTHGSTHTHMIQPGVYATR
jgi:hypothetical protein